MFSLEQIKAMNADAAIMARGKKKKPFKLSEPKQVDEMPPFPFPELGDAVEDFDDQYERLDSLFCDHSGWGSSGERALTVDQLKMELKRLLGEHGTLYLAIEEVGQFQLYLAVWKEKAGW